MVQRPITKSLAGTRLCQAAATMQKLIGTLLSLSITCQAANLTPQERILAIPPQSFIEVKLADKTKVRGRLDKIDTDGFIVTTPAADQASVIEPRISFSEVKSVKQLKDEPGTGGQIAREAGRTGLKVVIIMGAIVAIGAIASALAK
jgi:hypothetical protein